MVSIVVGEDLHHIFRTFYSDLRNLPLIRTLGDFFCQESHPLHPARTNGRRPTSALDSVVLTAEDPFRASPEEWFLKRNKHRNYKDDGDPNFVFDALDSVIVGTMERLKKLSFCRKPIFEIVRGSLVCGSEISLFLKRFPAASHPPFYCRARAQPPQTLLISNSIVCWRSKLNHTVVFYGIGM